MTPTPTQLRDLILVSIGKLTHFQVDVEVSCREVADDVLSHLGYVPDDVKKARNNINFAATQHLRIAGLLAPASKRGMWTLSPKGVSAAKKLAGITSTEDPVTKDLPEPVVSPWADDPVGEVVCTEVLTDTYAEDTYVKALGISHVQCFGGFRETEPICTSCPIAGSCQAQFFRALSELASNLNRQVLKKPDAPAEETTPSSTNVRETNLMEILSELQNQTNKAPRAVGREMVAPVDSVCYLCNGKLPEGSIIVHVHNKGVRHKDACPK